jgi:hypothetical protein
VSIAVEGIMLKINDRDKLMEYINMFMKWGDVYATIQENINVYLWTTQSICQSKFSWKNIFILL